ncbi:hypothetical protein DM01DRAFT_16232 [Hesseltinella vesiculosa]|uniref:Uncharacterized protein n=1 Tax=Hesseltinella vesiculosa TaxID=101127 RepID=A0A1X2GBU1_9FUNG|nr:hypothetical protein DM01DRAFT_16232 [Hesseltinella vesiculosa]
MAFASVSYRRALTRFDLYHLHLPCLSGSKNHILRTSSRLPFVRFRLLSLVADGRSLNQRENVGIIIGTAVTPGMNLATMSRRGWMYGQIDRTTFRVLSCSVFDPWLVSCLMFVKCTFWPHFRPCVTSNAEKKDDATQRLSPTNQNASTESKNIVLRCRSSRQIELDSPHLSTISKTGANDRSSLNGDANRRGYLQHASLRVVLP